MWLIPKSQKGFSDPILAKTLTGVQSDCSCACWATADICRLASHKPTQTHEETTSQTNCTKSRQGQTGDFETHWLPPEPGATTLETCQARAAVARPLCSQDRSRAQGAIVRDISSLNSHGRFKHLLAGFGRSCWESLSMCSSTAPSSSCPT